MPEQSSYKTIWGQGEATFATTLRVLLFRRAALGRRTPWPLAEAARELELHPKTLKRYVKVLALTEHDEDGRPLIRIEHLDNRPFLLNQRF